MHKDVHSDTMMQMELDMGGGGGGDPTGGFLLTQQQGFAPRPKEPLDPI